MAISKTLFRAYDIRGKVGEELDADAAYAIGRAIGSEARQRGICEVALGRDGRLSSPSLARAVASGLCASGITLKDAGCVPTPLLYFAAITCCDGNGVMVTGSHNPPQYNGVKVMLGGETLYGEAITSLYQRVVTGAFVSGEGRVESLSPCEEYLTRLCAQVTLERPLRVVVDCGNGVAGVIAPAMLRRLGCEVVELYCEVDGRFPHHHPDPNQPQNLQALQRTVLDTSADIGLAFDGDGDRVGVVSADGAIVWPDRLMMLYARDLLRRHPGAEVIYDIKCSRNLGRVIEAAGGRAQMWRTGHSLLKAKMQQSGALLAGEMSGHIFLREGWFGVDDALFAAARLLQLVAAESRGPQALFDELPDMLNTPELHVEMEGAHEFMAELQRHKEAFDGARLTTIDGLRADYEDGWGLVRASNTTPTLVLRFEAETEDALERIEGVFSALILQLRPELKLPF